PARAILRLERHLPRVTALLLREPSGEPGARLLEGAVLQQPREQQIPRFEQCDILRVDQLTLGQQARDLQVEQRRCDDEELARAIELYRALPLNGREVRDELVGHQAERDL